MNYPTQSELLALMPYLSAADKRELDALLQTSRFSDIGLSAFKQAVSRHYQHAPHLALLDEKLEAVARYVETGGTEGIWLLIVEMPPRHGKTYTVSRRFPAWFAGRNPDMRQILVSYGDSLARKNSRYVRNLMASPVYQQYFPIQLAQDSKAVDAFDIAGHEGGLDAMGILGAATGKGAHLLNCDDLTKNREEAESPTLREKTWDAFNDDLMSRLEPAGAVILTATRWSTDDTTGRVLKYFKSTPKKPIVRLRLPALAEANDPLGRAEGAALWADRYPVEELQSIAERMGEYSWASLYQQRPVPAEGGIFKQVWFTPLVDECPPIVRSVRYWDLAMSAKTSADYTAGVKIGEGVDGHWYITDVVHAHVDWGDLTDFMARVILEDGAQVPQGIEEKGYMSRAIQDLNMDARMHGFQIWGYPVDSDKLTRALPFAAKCGAGLVHVLNRHWTPTYIEELCLFTGRGDMHDDQVDASSGAYAMLGENVVEGAISYGSYDPMEGSA